MKVTVILPLLRLIRVDPPAAVVGEEDDDGVAVLVGLLQRPHHLAHRRLQLLQLGATILDQIAVLLSSCLRLKKGKIQGIYEKVFIG
jgi:hypothetical protein